MGAERDGFQEGRVARVGTDSRCHGQEAGCSEPTVFKSFNGTWQIQTPVHPLVPFLSYSPLNLFVLPPPQWLFLKEITAVFFWVRLMLFGKEKEFSTAPAFI